ncbi:MAG: response regulator [Pyrinomonadaceae bacterium]
MNLTDKRRQQLDAAELDADGQALALCGLAAERAFNGQFEEACEALGEFWRGVGQRPPLKGLAERTRAELLMQCGVLTCRLGSARNIAGALEAAKDLLSEAVRLFATIEAPPKVAEAQYELGLCYWRLGALDEARVVLAESLGLLPDADELKARILIRQTLVEISARRYREAWDLLIRAESIFAAGGDTLKGRWHGQRGLVLRRMAVAEDRSDLSDRAIIEFTAAIFHFEQAGHERLCGNNLNNLAMLLYRLGRYEDAHGHLDRARQIFARLKDSGSVAQVDETRARVLVAERRYAEARGVISVAVTALAEGGELALLADAMIVEGVVQARLNEHELSAATLQRAVEVAEGASAPESAGLAALALLEEHGAERLSPVELAEWFHRADELLARTQDAEDIARLRKCARLVTGKLAGVAPGTNFSLPQAVLAYEARFIEQALREENGSVSRAARRLGIKHQSLAHLLKARHQNLIEARTPAVPRRRSIITIHDPRRHAYCRLDDPGKKLQPISILHVEDNAVVARTVKELLENEGWAVEVSEDGDAAWKLIESRDRYDLLLLDYDLPGMDGLELARRARALAHRQDSLIVMLSADDLEADAQRAGADAFLRKPDGIVSLANTITELLSQKSD